MLVELFMQDSPRRLWTAYCDRVVMHWKPFWPTRKVGLFFIHFLVRLLPRVHRDGSRVPCPTSQRGLNKGSSSLSRSVRHLRMTFGRRKRGRFDSNFASISLPSLSVWFSFSVLHRCVCLSTIVSLISYNPFIYNYLKKSRWVYWKSVCH